MADLGRGRAAGDLATRLDGFLRGDVTSAAFAVTGPWGAGKTTLLRDALARVAPKRGDRHLVVEFTPWMYANEAAIFEGFAVMLLQHTLQRGRVRKRVAAGLRVLAAPLQALPVDASASARALAEMVDIAYTPEQIQASMAETLRAQDRRVLVVVDDLDRLDASELLTMFKLLRLVTDVAGFGFVLAFDEDTLLHLLQQTAIAHGSRERARQYLEKVVERRVQVSPLTVEQMLSLLQPTLEAMPSSANVSDGLGSFRLDVLLESSLTTPRAVERFAQALRDVPTRLAGEVDHWDLCSAVFLRMFFPDVWGLILRERRTLTAAHRGFADYFGEGPKQRAVEIQKRLLDLYAAEPDGADLRQLVEYLFPGLAALADGRPAPIADRAGQRIGDPEYVDRYLWLDLPPGSISDGEVRDQLRNLASEQDVADIVEILARKPASAMTVLERALRAGVTTRSVLFRVLDASFGVGNPSGPLADAALAFARTLLLQCEPEELEALIAGHHHVAGWPLLRHLLIFDQSMPNLPEQMPLKPALQQARSDLRRSLTESLQQSASIGIEQEEARRDWFDLRRLGGAAAAIAVDRFTAMRWSALDIASLGLRIAYDSAGPFVTLDLPRLRELLGSEFVDQLRRSALPPYPVELATGEAWRLHEPVISQALANHITSYVLTTGTSFGEDPFADRLL